MENREIKYANKFQVTHNKETSEIILAFYQDSPIINDNGTEITGAESILLGRFATTKHFVNNLLSVLNDCINQEETHNNEDKV